VLGYFGYVPGAAGAVFGFFRWREARRIKRALEGLTTGDPRNAG
jgi:hypothetical protein